jgi:hypothetical protein
MPSNAITGGNLVIEILLSNRPELNFLWRYAQMKTDSTLVQHIKYNQEPMGWYVMITRPVVPPFTVRLFWLEKMQQHAAAYRSRQQRTCHSGRRNYFLVE